MKRIQTFSNSKWKPSLGKEELNECVKFLEGGSVLYFPNLHFSIHEDEKALFSSNLVSKGRKNLSYNLLTDKLKGFQGNFKTEQIIHQMLKRFASYAKAYINHLLPCYKENLIMGLTSFRPVEIKGCEPSSYKKNDTLLHIDSFSSTPTGGRRILRFFANANPFNIPRVWIIGESYKQVIKRFLPQIKSPLFGSRTLMHRFGITKSYRILYDHYMLQIHDKMKADTNYQKKVDQEKVEFSSFSCWLAFTDQVSHAALSGQYVFEQSFYLPTDAQVNPNNSPLIYMEKLFQKSLRT